MADKTWIGKAPDVRQRSLITIAGTPAAGETVTITINGKALIVTIGTDTSTTDVAEAIVLAWNATQRTSDATTGSSNFGGQEHGEFAEITCTSSGAVVTLLGPAGSGPSAGLTSRRGPAPFTVATTDTMGAGTATDSTPQAASGKSHWDNALNWSSGTVPANGDVLVFIGNDVDCLYGLAAGSLEATILQYQSYTGRCGLPAVNAHIPSKPYYEYRTRHVKFDDSGTATTKNHVFGLGDGAGCPLFNFVHDTAANSNTVTVYNTGTPQISGTKALNIAIDSAGNGDTISILRGSVNCSAQFSTTPTFGTLNIGYLNSQPSDCDVEASDAGYNCTINQYGGTLTVNDTANASALGTRAFNVQGGTLVVRSIQTSSNVTVTAYNSTVVWSTSKTITTLIVGSGGVLDAEKGTAGFTMTTCDLFQGASLLDEFARGTYTAGIDLNRCGIDDVTIRVGQNRRLTLGTAA